MPRASYVFQCPTCTEHVSLHVTPTQPPTCNSPKHGTSTKVMVLNESQSSGTPNYNKRKKKVNNDK